MPAANPIKASKVIFFKYHIKFTCSIPITATPAADPIIIALPRSLLLKQEIPRMDGLWDMFADHTCPVMLQPTAHYLQRLKANQVQCQLNNHF